MVRRKTKKGSLRDYIFEAFREKRTVPEVIKYIREKYGIKEISNTTIYHHIRRIKNNEDTDYSLIQEGNKYQFISNKEKYTADDSYLFWFMDRYLNAFERKNQGELYWLRNELHDLCLNKIIDNEQFVDFVITMAKGDSYELFEKIGIDLGANTFISWECINLLNNRMKNNTLKKKLQVTQDFFKKIVLDYEGKYTTYGEERSKALFILQSFFTIKMVEVALDLLSNITPNKKLKFSPGKFRKISEFNLFKYQIELIISQFAINNPLKCRQYLFEIYKKRKKSHGNKDIILKEISKLLEHVRYSEPQFKEIREWEKKIREDPDLKAYLDKYG